MENKLLCCRICANSAGNRPFIAREMMFGTREAFDYFECVGCGCVQISVVPENLSKYYPDEYYSFENPSRIRTLVKGPWLCDPFPATAAVKRVLSLLPGVRLMPDWMARARLNRKASILEIGSGNGARLIAMSQLGYSDLTGVDPFIRADHEYANGIRILKKEIREITRPYDFVMLNHAFEHLPDQAGTLREIGRILKEDGTVLIRIPVAGSHAWKKYGTNWLGLDPPRHLFLHTLESLKLLADQTGFKISDLFFDSDGSQFWGSEQYAKDIPLRDPRSYFEDRRHSIFSRAEIKFFAARAKRLNREKAGDSAAFYLRKKVRV